MDAENLSRRIREKLMQGIFAQRLIDNNFRGPWTEYMVAEALGDECGVVSEGWHAWDLQIGKAQDEFPDRIRIQVKNTARIQTWYKATKKPSYCKWVLPLTHKPWYFDEYNPNVPCESYGHLCDVYILCHHPIEDSEIADHRNPFQWEFYVVPVTPKHEFFPVILPLEDRSAQRSYTVVPKSLRKGIRGRPPIEPVKFDQLNMK